MNNARARTLATNSLFSALLLSASGWGLFHAWAIGIGAGGLVHALVAVPGLTLSGLVLHRYSLHWPARTASRNHGRESGRHPWSPGLVASYILLPATGIAIALLVNHGSLFALVIVTIGLVFVPWTKFAFCRDHFFLALAMIAVGGALGLSFSGKPPHSTHYPLCAWIFLVASIVTVISIIFTHRNQTDRMPPSGY